MLYTFHHTALRECHVDRMNIEWITGISSGSVEELRTQPCTARITGIEYFKLRQHQMTCYLRFPAVFFVIFILLY